MKITMRTVLLSLSILLCTSLFAQEGVMKKRNGGKADMEKIVTALDLNETQQKQFKKISIEKIEKIKELRSSRKSLEGMKEEEAKAKRAELNQEKRKIEKGANNQVKAILSPEQFEKYTVMMKERRKSIKNKKIEGEKHRPMKQKGDMHPEEQN